MNIGLFGSARNSVPQIYIAETEQLGKAMARRGHGLVFGGGSAGLMGAAARGMQALGGRIISVAPEFFQRPGVLVEGPAEEIITDTMSRRKEIIIDRSDAFVAVPGGIGTLDEFFEVFTLLSLKQHAKPVALYNIAGFFDGLLAYLGKLAQEDFLFPGLMDQLGVFESPETVLDYLEHQTR